MYTIVEYKYKLLILYFGLLFILCFAFAAIVTFTALRQWLVPAVADEPTAHVVPFLYPLCKLFYELVSCINK